MKNRESIRGQGSKAPGAIPRPVNAGSDSRAGGANRERQVRKSRPESDSYSEKAPLGMIIIRQDGSFEYVNPKFTQMFGYALNEIPNGKTWFRKAYPDVGYRREVISTWVDLLSTSDEGEMAAHIFTVRCKDGSAKTIRFRPVQMEDGHYLITCEDITEVTRSAEALRLEKAKFQGLAQNLPLGVVMIGKDGTYEYINPKFTRIFGYDLTDVPNGKEWFRKAYPDPQYRKDVIRAWINGQEPGEQCPRTFTVTCKDGSEKTIHFRPVQLETGEHLITCEDITHCTLKAIYGISLERADRWSP